MKKTKLIKSLGALAALTAPVTTILMTTTGCSGKNYAELISEMKDECIQTFMYMCKNVHRNVWNEGEAYSYIQEQMYSILGKKEPDGYDKWSQLNAYKRVVEKERSYLEQSYGDYGNMWYDIPASPGFDKAPKIILQCHMDSQMAFKNDDAHELWAKTPKEGGCTEPDFSNTDEIMKSKTGNTSLGSDGGFGISALITIAKYRNKFNHPGLRLLFTAGESEAIAKYKDSTTNVEYPEYAAGFALLEYDQTGVLPAGETEGFQFHVGSKPFGDYDGEYKYIISETGVIKNNIFVSSSGIHECSLHTPKTIESYNTLNEDTSTPKQAHAKDGNKIDWDTQKDLPWKSGTSRKWIEIKVSNFQGGTSSTYIGKGQGSAVRFLYKILFCGDTDMQLINSHSEPDNAYTISTDASVQLATFYDVDIWKKKIESILPSFKILWPNEDWNNVINSISVKELTPTAEMPKPVHAMSAQQTRDLIRMVATELYFGPINYFEDGTVKTSENIGPCCLDIHEGDTNQTSFELNFHVVERSSETDQLYIFQELTHSILADCFDAWFQDDTWQEKLVTHVADPVWKAPDKENPNRLAAAFQQAYNNFKIRNKVANEHAWLEIACAPTIYENVGFTTIPNCVMIGVQVEKNHAIDEILYTDTIATVLETTVYVLENANSIIPK